MNTDNRVKEAAEEIKKLKECIIILQKGFAEAMQKLQQEDKITQAFFAGTISDSAKEYWFKEFKKQSAPVEGEGDCQCTQAARFDAGENGRMNCGICGKPIS